MLTVSHLTKRYGSTLAVDDLSFTAEPGRIYGLLGPNGAGKSTTMNMITGYLAPTEGQVEIDGIDLLKRPEKAKEHIGYLPEIPPVYPDMTVGEYLSFAARLKKLSASKREEDIAKVMERTDIASVSDRLIRNLSKGYRQRVGLAQAILGDAGLLILDEPTVGLDPQQIVEIRELIRSLSGERTVILSSHILQEVSAVCDHIMVLSHGRLVASDSAEHLSVSVGAAERLYLSAKTDGKRMRDILSGIEGVTEPETADISEEGITRLSIKMPENMDIREAVFRAFAEAGEALLELSLKKETLEDTYLRLISDSDEKAKETKEENTETRETETTEGEADENTETEVPEEEQGKEEEE